jgi:hypothetical protein
MSIRRVGFVLLIPLLSRLVFPKDKGESGAQRAAEIDPARAVRE